METSTHSSLSSEKSLLAFAKQHLRHRAALNSAKGGAFNIFRILGIGHLEVQTHSPILAELLDPQGAHSQGEMFLDLFLKQMDIQDFYAPSASVRCEFFCGKSSPSHGRRIDVLLEDSFGKRIFIENKIYAGDQPGQIASYHKHDPQAHIFYLTLFGGAPSNLPEEELAKTGCRCISYETDILLWLEDCRREAATLPVVRETLTQYIRLIRELTHQSTTHKMNQELIEEIIKDEETYAAFLAIADARTAVEEALVQKLYRELEQVAKELKVSFKSDGRQLSQQYGGFAFHSPMLDAQGLSVYFQFQKKGYRDLFFGFSREEEGTIVDAAEQLFEAFHEIEPNAERDKKWWVAGGYMQGDFRNWRDSNFKVLSSGRMTKEIRKILESLLLIADRVLKPNASNS
jgi:hypothetical protein